MTEEKKNGWGSVLEKLEHQRNRSHIVKADGDGDFAISFRDVRHVEARDHDALKYSERADYCVVEFLIARDEQQIAFPVYIKREEVDPMDYLREAAHRLHLDLVKLCEQTASLKLRDQEPEAEPVEVTDPEVPPRRRPLG